MNLIEELRWRNMIQDIIPKTEEQLLRESTKGYIGFDPTAGSLHIGSLVPIILLVHLQKAGHQPIALLGGATGMVGDPSGKSEERNLLTEEQLQKNIMGIKNQLSRYLNFDDSLPNRAILVNNFDWFENLSFLDFLRETGKNVTVNYMMAKDSVKKRIQSDAGISYTEFSYQLMQGYDFYWLYKNMGCKLQMGGSDQWGNITTGNELIRRKLAKEAYAFTCPLIKKTDGGKFGKTEQGNIWLDKNRTSPYQFYQFWLNASDDDAINWIKIFTFLPKNEIDELTKQHNSNSEERILQKKMAEEITVFVHGKEEYRQAIGATSILFSSSNTADDLTEDDLESIKDRIVLSKKIIEKGIDIVSLIAESKILPSKGESRKMISGGGISINKNKEKNSQRVLMIDDLLFEKYLLIQKGKKNYFLLKFI